MAAATTMATAAGAVVLLYYVLNRRLSSAKVADGDHAGEDGYSRRSAKRRMSRRPVTQAPATWFETIMTLSETLRFTYSETLGKWPIGDLAFGINYLIRRQVSLFSLRFSAEMFHFLGSQLFMLAFFSVFK